MEIQYSFNKGLQRMRSTNVCGELEFYTKCVNIFSAAYVPEKYHLTKRELSLFVGVLQLKSNNNSDMFNDESLEHLKNLGFKNKRILQIWLPKLEKKSWIKIVDGLVYTENYFEDLCKGDTVRFDLDVIKKDEFSGKDNI